MLFFRCYPRLNEGDQVVMINNRDVSQHTHDQVVNFIRASSEPHSAQLVLAVRQVSHTQEWLQGSAIVDINLVSSLQLFPLKLLNHGLFGRMKKIASRPNLEQASKEQL